MTERDEITYQISMWDDLRSLIIVSQNKLKGSGTLLVHLNPQEWLDVLSDPEFRNTAYMLINEHGHYVFTYAGVRVTVVVEL